MQDYNKKKPRSGRNCGTIRYRPKGLRASEPQMSERESTVFWRSVQEPDHLLAMVMDNDIRCDQLDPEDWIEIERAAERRQIFEERLRLKAENAALKAEIEALRAENVALKSQQSNPPASESLKETSYRDAVSISPATKEKRKLANFFRRVRLFFILLDTFNQIIKHRCKFDDDDAEIEGCGSVLRKIFELVTNISADISENTFTIPDLDFKFYGSKEEFKEFAKKVSELICENRLNIPDTHFIIGKMRRFTAKKPMSNGQIVQFEKFTLKVIDSSTKEIFMIDIMNVDGSTVCPCDFTVNSLVVSPTRGIYAKNPLHRKGKFNFLGVIRDISSRETTCMTKSPWKFENHSLTFLVRQIKMIEAGYAMLGAPILTTATCPVMCEDALCVSLTGCRCKNTKGDTMPVQMSICAAIGIYEREKRCPNCRAGLIKFVCSAVESRKFMYEQNERLSQAEFDLLVKHAERMCQGYLFSGLAYLSEESKDSLRTLSEFSRKIEDVEEDVSNRGAGGGAAAPDLALQMRAEEEDFAPVIDRAFLRELFQLRIEEEAQYRAEVQARAIQMRAGGGAAAPAPVHRRQYDSDSDSDGGYGNYIRYGS